MLRILPVSALLVLLAAFFFIILYAMVRGNEDRSFKRRNRTNGMEIRGHNLRSRLALFPLVLMLALIYTVSIPLYLTISGTRQEALLRGLWDRSAVFMEMLSHDAGSRLSVGDTEGLGLLPDRMAVVAEARYITITGNVPGSYAREEVVWATNDPDILSKIDTYELRPGVSRLRDAVSPRLWNVGLDPDDWAGRLHSEPEFAFRYLMPNEYRRFVFFRPVAYGGYVLGVVRMEVCTDAIMEWIGRYNEMLRRRVLIAAFVAFAIGTAGLFVHSTVSVARVRRLLDHARLVIAASDDRSLSHMEIHLRGQDEIAVLGNIFNDMTQRLAKTTTTMAGLSAGKRLQRKLLPLDTDEHGNTFDFSYREVDDTIFFAYYEEADEISGDYFDYRNLDGRYYAIIKCDVAGSGAPAALITMQIATMFRSYFWSWDSGMMGHLEELVYMINEFIEKVGASRRFAAFTLCLFDSKTGDMHFCNAGDNTVHIFDSAEKRVKPIALPETPAAGILPYNMVMSKGGYRIQTITLDRGDILFLYTDGLEESRRKFRGPVFDGNTCTIGANRVNHGNYVAGQWGEELGRKRIYDIIDAVTNLGTYKLHKWHTPDGRDEYLHFDFARCRGGVDEVIIALASVEKMFRCYRFPDMTDDDRVLIDTEIDTFLRSHFLQYDSYCAHRRKCPSDKRHIYYTHLREEYRVDDLAILGVERKLKSTRGETV